MQPEQLLPENLDLRVLKNRKSLTRFVRMATARKLDQGYVNSRLSELVFGPQEGMNARDYTVTAFAIYESLQTQTGSKRSKTLTQYLPNYLQIGPAPADIGSRPTTHLLLGSLHPYSTLAHQFWATDIYGYLSTAVAIDIESPKLTNIGNKSVQATSGDLPFGDNSLDSVMTNNLFGHFNSSILVEVLEALSQGDIDMLDPNNIFIQTFDEVLRTLKPGGIYMGVEDHLSTALLAGLCRNEENCAFEVGPAIRTIDRYGERQILSHSHDTIEITLDPNLNTFRITKLY